MKSLLAAVAAIFFVPLALAAQTGTINQLNPFTTSGDTVRLASTTAALRVPSLANLGCIGTNALGVFQGGTCTGSTNTLGTTSPWTAGALARVVDNDTLTSIATSSLNIGASALDLVDITLSDFINDAGFITGNQNITLSGDVAGSGTTAITTTIGADKVLESMLKAVNAAVDEDILTFEATTGDFEWHTPAELSLQALDGMLTALSGLTSAQGDLLYFTGSDAVATLAKNTSASRYLSNTGASNNPAWAQVDLTNGVTGALPYTNGGTGTSSPGVWGDVLYWNGTNWQGRATSSLGISASAGGSDTQVQYNDTGALAGDADFTYNDTTAFLTVGGFSLAGGEGNAFTANGTGANALVFQAANADASSAEDGGDLSFFAGQGDGVGLGGTISFAPGMNGAGTIPNTFDIYNAVSDATASVNIAAISANRTLSLPNLSGAFALGSYTTGFTGGHIPFGSSGLLATSSALTFDGTKFSTTYASTTALTISGNAYIGTLSGVLIGTSGAVSAGVDGTDYSLINAVSCTNQVMTALTAAGVGTCSSINNAFWSGTDLSVANGGTGLSTFGGSNTVLYTTAADTLASEAAFLYDPSVNRLTFDLASTTIVSIGANGVTLNNDGDGALQFTGTSAGSDESLVMNLDDTSNEVVWSSGSGIATSTWSSIGLAAPSIRATSYVDFRGITSWLGTLLGAIDAGGAESFEIPNGTNPTVDAIGEIALDTTDEQLLIASTSPGLPVVIPLEQALFSMTIGSTSPSWASTTPIDKWRTEGREITRFSCFSWGGTSKVLNVTDGAGNDTETITCDADGAEDTSVDTNATFTANELWLVEGGATTGAVNYVTMTAYGYFTRE